MTIKALGKSVACEPFAHSTVEKKIVGGMVVPEQKITLSPLKVVFGNDSVGEGDIVYTRSNNFTSLWGRAVYEIDGKSIIMVPEAEILLVKPAYPKSLAQSQNGFGSEF